ncbi:hypothetical protein FB451DRAFT_1246995 [Mycena latifolia]|nr:hypothetical protein FB451DRAFT_1246995 [Mycena latifolia]
MEETALNNLPIELERVIFEITAWQYPETITTLILVARRVCVWIEPLLYQVVLSSGSGEWVLQMMQSKPPEFLREHVHHLALSSGVQRSDVTYILSTCTNICDLALWTGDTYPGLLADMRHLTNLQRLSINLFELFGGHHQFKLPPIEELPFAHLTHLDIFSDIPESVWPVFAMLPSLTHLSISDHYSPNLLRKALDTCSLLQLLVVVWTADGPGVEGTLEITDPRFCMTSCTQFENDWELGAWGGFDFWRRAEDFVARKSRGEIPESKFEA